MSPPPTLPESPTNGVGALLSDGSVANVRPVVPEDLPRLLDLHRQAPARSRLLRFFVADKTPAEQYAKHLIDAADGQLAFVAARDGQLLAVASAEPLPNLSAGDPHEGEAEVALYVGERWQHTGVGTLLLEHLSAAARVKGICRFTALVPTENAAMFDVFTSAGFDVHLDRPVRGQVIVRFDLQGTRALAAAVAARERRATAASLVPILSPGSVIVVGASRQPGTVGHAVVTNLRSKNFTGRLAAVNRHVVDGEQIGSVPAYRSASLVPWGADLAVIAVPGQEVAAALESCGTAGVRGAVVLTGGFAEIDNPDGQAELVRIAHRYGMRLIGPNCLGVLNTDPAIRLDATFASSTPVAMGPAGVGLAAQSGALGIAVLDAASACGLGLSSFVSLGNKADISGNDMLLYWAGDPRTRVIGLYLESIGNPRRFRRIAGEVARTKPIVALRSGRSVAGARAGISHTAAAMTSDAVTQALFRDAGVISADTTEELIDLLTLLGTEPVPAGRRVMILGNAGGSLALAADAAEAVGAVLPQLTAATAELLKTAMKGAVTPANPVDLGTTSSPETYRAALEVLLRSGETDAVVVLHVATAAQSTDTVIRAIEQTKLDAGTAVTMAGALIGAQPPRGGAMPWYGFAESAAHAVGRVGELAGWRARAAASVPGATGTPPVPAEIDTDAIGELLETAPRSPDGWLSAAATTQLLQLIGVPTGTNREVPGAAAAARISAPTGSSELTVQPLISPGLELLVGLDNPAQGMPVVIVAAGGRHEDVLDDRVLRTLPLSDGDASDMVGQLRCAPLLSGHRGSPALDRLGVVAVLERIALLDTIAPQIRELGINPLIVSEQAVIAVDAKVRIAAPGEPRRRRDSVHDDYERSLG